MNFPFSLEEASDGSLNGELITADIAYAVDPWTQVSAILALPFAHAVDFGTQSSFGDIGFEYGRRFGRDATKGYFGIAPAITLPTGNQDYGLGAGRVTIDFPILYQKDIADLSLYTDLRYRLHGGDNGRSYWFWGVAGEQDISERFSVGAELFTATPSEESGPWAAGFNLGTNIALIGDTRFLFSIGRAFNREPKLTLYAGVQVLTRKEGQ
ncbi:hypothetical protein C3F09_10290 [candidate division GN15 bacterium]|uniref:Transporter n=1 Tax=candidate division GN15 bacterium TaxID=2072418 RepID=A0A855X390_9BACT|nr:MAG: hypothetical protein C3F09_10290 [candidate division GN15 bacterium]